MKGWCNSAGMSFLSSATQLSWGWSFISFEMDTASYGHMPFASPSLRLGQERTRSLYPPCSSKDLRSGVCNSFWDHTQSHSSTTRATATLLMSLPYHVLHLQTWAWLLPWPGKRLTYLPKKGIFHTLMEKPGQDDFLLHPFFSNSKFPFKQFHLNGEGKILSPFAQHNMGSFTQCDTGRALVRQQRAAL